MDSGLHQRPRRCFSLHKIQTDPVDTSVEAGAFGHRAPRNRRASLFDPYLNTALVDRAGLIVLGHERPDQVLLVVDRKAGFVAVDNSNVMNAGFRNLLATCPAAKQIPMETTYSQIPSSPYQT